MDNHNNYIFDEFNQFNQEEIQRYQNELRIKISRKCPARVSGSLESTINAMHRFETAVKDTRIKGNKRNGTQDRQQAFKHICK